MSTKRFTLSAFVVILILAFTATSVGAEGQPGTVDEDGDLIIDVFPQVDISAARGLPDQGSLAELPALPGGDISVDTVPIHPVGYEDVFTKYPTFIFGKDVAAFKYQVEVFDLIPNPAVSLYRFSGPPNCVAGECALTPTTALKPLTILFNSGYYGWHARSKTSLMMGWGPWSSGGLFYVLKNGFNSTFTALDNKWVPVFGDWTITSTGYAKTKGEIGVLHSAIEKHLVSEGFVYEVRMKHKDDLSASNRLFFQGYPGTLNAEKDWRDGYEFIIRNNGQWQLVKSVDGVGTELSYGTSPYIIPYGWNKVTIMTDDPFIDFWINGEYIGYFLGDTSFDAGFVGFGAFSNDGGEAFLVDYAKLVYTTELPYPFSYSSRADGQRDPAFEMKFTDAELGEDLTVLP